MPFPSENTPGKWIEEDKIKLLTLSGIVKYGTQGGRLYKAEFEGDKEKLGRSDFIWYSTPRNEYQKIQINSRNHIDSCINLGVKVKKARLLKRVRNWTPYLIWSFAIDCIEHAYIENDDLVDIVPDIYKKGILFLRPFSKYYCGMGGLELENFVNMRIGDKNFIGAVGKTKTNLYKLVKEELKDDYGSTKFLGEAIAEAFNLIYPFTVARKLRTLASWSQENYHDEYEIPSMVDIDKQVLQERIWLALDKKELDWQVNHLRLLLGD